MATRSRHPAVRPAGAAEIPEKRNRVDREAPDTPDGAENRESRAARCVDRCNGHARLGECCAQLRREIGLPRHAARRHRIDGQDDETAIEAAGVERDSRAVLRACGAYIMCDLGEADDRRRQRVEGATGRAR